MNKISIFISYSHEDENYKDKLEKHLSILKRNKIIETWHDRKIIPGEDWDKKIRAELETAQIILLLVSVDFLSSDYCYDIEIKRAVERNDNGEAVVIPIILRKCDWNETSFSKIQALPKNAKAVKNFDDEDEAFYSIVEGIKLSIEELKKKNILPVNDSKESNSLSITHINKYECDTPPNILHWVGRRKEIDAIDQDLHKVVYISGIGGQGKSGLASHYLKNVVGQKPRWEFWDWRDCQEKENRIHVKLISIISRLTKNRIKASQISDASIDQLIDLLFEELGNRNIIFVFDNIDAYIEFENFHLFGAILKLYSAALKRDHSSKFIFTCRTSLSDVDTELLQIRLQGLSLDETTSLFTDYNLSFNKDQVIQLSQKAYNLTKGHPLWLNLLAAQARRGLSIAEEFINGISQNSNFQEESLSSVLSGKILNAIWNTLNDKQKTLLMAFAEIVRAESESNLSSILNSELNYNQFCKAFKALKQLNLVVIKSMFGEQDTFELHPLVKEYIIQNFGRVERSKFISLFVNFYDNVILVLKSKLSSDQPLNFFENWTAKIELAINNDDYKSALTSLEEVSSSICEAGFIEEYLRVANLLFVTIDWKIALNEEYSYFNTQFSKFIDTTTEFGKFNEAAAYLTKYEKNIISKGPNYFRFCKVKGQFYWFQGQFDKAIELLEEGVALEQQSVTKVDLDLKHSLALSLRDTRIPENIDRAISLFLNDKTVDSVLQPQPDNYILGETYGNIGRCLYFKGDFENAIKCYKRSLQKLDNRMNKGYGYLWIAESLIASNRLEEALWFYREAFNIWKPLSPIKTHELEKKISAIVEVNPSINFITDKSDWEVNKFTSKFIDTL